MTVWQCCNRNPHPLDGSCLPASSRGRIDAMPDAQASTECAVWYLRWGRPDYDLADTEREAADLAVSIEDADQGGAIEGVQFADGRTIEADDWTELHAARERRRAAEREWQHKPPPPTRPGRDPFSGTTIEIETDSPAWVGA